MGFNTGLSGLRASSVDLDVTGNNIANASTVGFKSSQAQFGDLGAEHELCWVYLGRARSEVRANVTEVSDWRYVSVVDLEREMGDTPGTFTPWFKMEWSRLNEEFAAQVREYSAPRQTGQA